MLTDGFESEIAIPSGISRADAAALQRCEGRVVFLPTIRRQLALADVAHESFATGGVAPDTLGLLLAYRRRFPAVIARVLPTRLVAYPLDLGLTHAGTANLRNTAPVDLCNGDPVSLVPPVFEGPSTDVRLESLDLTLRFPVTLPSSLAREIVARLVARGIRSLNPDPRAPAELADLNAVYYNGARLPLVANVEQLEPVNAEVRTLILNAAYSITEGTAVVLSLIPRLFALSAQDGYVNTLLQMQSATREAAQLIHPEAPGPPQDGDRRLPVYEALVAWLTHASQLGDALALAPVARVCTFDGPAVVRSGDLAPVIRYY
ncbi:capsid triplex subunit 2 [Macacine alphaherpesvirus 1]|uniref:Capsid protein n=1 Tax=Cercopithecine herpesvirus 1 TaxID=10325 RepID=Q806B1_CHV1|nr:capsid triplex subunit 2 [Macacine alphaherpesvirus 1]ARS01954.1 capsid triplex subunit 2 [Macacine alphaherpesvirus 1]ARS02029.1 capsid triplex subunit 2 [Macacine alphaherpesvirus 1]ARS02104.1 capsid triplex subunit 2 [Macacine alphaherpesvirus 1]ARS02179.1 capsid triplex subunit 2 [Macacine alphaherpesvirus 1]